MLRIHAQASAGVKASSRSSQAVPQPDVQANQIKLWSILLTMFSVRVQQLALPHPQLLRLLFLVILRLSLLQHQPLTLSQ
jgi:hypothetical protein